jgi:hypothetical protein
LVVHTEGGSRLRVFGNRVLRTIFGPKRGEITREWRKLHHEKLNDLYCSPNVVRVIKSRRMRWVGHVARMGESRGVYRVLVGNPERPNRGWEDNIKMDLQGVGCGGMDWNELAQDRDRWRAVVKTVTWGTRWRSWFRHCAASRKVAGSIPDGVTRILH